VLSFLAGLALVRYIQVPPAIVYRYPTPENAGKIVYRDLNGACFVYDSKEVNCDANEGRLSSMPLQ
jgi:hypothetical protein